MVHYQVQSSSTLDAEARAVHIASTQHGTLSRSQAASCGLTAHQVRYRVRQGRWAVLGSGALLVTRPASQFSAVAGACVCLNAVASHRTAAWLWGIHEGPPSLIEVTVPRTNSRRRDSIEIYSSTQFQLAGVTEINQIPTTGLTRTVLDLAAVLPEAELLAAMESALDHKLVSVPELERALNAHSVRGRPGLSKFRRVLHRCSQPRTAIPRSTAAGD